MLRTLIGTALVGTLAWADPAGAEDWPTRPITMVVPFAAGGTTDVVGRVMAQHVGEILGQQIVVENVGASGGMTGSLRIAQARPDGYQLLLGSLGAQALNQTLYKKPGYNTLTDFAPVSLFVQVPLVLITRKDLPANHLQEFISYTKANQGTMTFASAGSGSAPHIGCVLLNTAMGTRVTHVPYRGSGPAMQDLVAGRTDFFCEALPTALPQIQNNSVKAIALLTRERVTVLPNLPTAQEQGLTDFEAYTWFAFFFPRGTPDAIVRRLQQATAAATKMPFVRGRLEALGASIVAPERTTPEYLGEFVRSEIEKWAAPIKASGASVD